MPVLQFRLYTEFSIDPPRKPIFAVRSLVAWLFKKILFRFIHYMSEQKWYLCTSWSEFEENRTNLDFKNAFGSTINNGCRVSSFFERFSLEFVDRFEEEIWRQENWTDRPTDFFDRGEYNCALWRASHMSLLRTKCKIQNANLLFLFLHSIDQIQCIVHIVAEPSVIDRQFHNEWSGTYVSLKPVRWTALCARLRPFNN